MRDGWRRKPAHESHHAGERMPRIGFAYNQKPEPEAVDDGERLADEEPPSSRRDDRSRPPAAASDAAGDSASPSGAASTDDEYAEWDSAQTIAAVEGALSALGTVVRLEATADFPERLRAERPDIVFNMAEGLHGVNREAHVPAICEFLGVPYSGSDPFTLSLCLDKARTKETLAFHGVPTAPFAVVRTTRDLDALLAGEPVGACDAAHRIPTNGARFPLFLKPIHEGSSKGITERNLVRTERELESQTHFLLESYAQPVLVETYLPGAEFTCAVLGNGDGARVLPIVGMNFRALPEGALPVYGFEAKWVWDRPENPLDIFECPARIDESLRASIERIVLTAYRVLGCRDWSRIDVRLDAAGVPNVVEVNPLPGILPDPEDNSCFPKAARAAGIGYDELIQRCLLLAAERQRVTLRTGASSGAHVQPDARVAARP